MVREVVLAAHWATDWPLSTWWARVTGEPSAATTVAAVLAGLLAVALLLLAVRQLGGRRRGPALVEFAGEHGWARLDVGALERALRRRLEVEFPGLKARADWSSANSPAAGEPAWRPSFPRSIWRRCRCG